MLNSTSTPDSVGGSRSNFDHEPSSYNVSKCFCQTALFCQLPVRIDERGGRWRREAEFGDVVQLAVTQGHSRVQRCNAVRLARLCRAQEKIRYPGTFTQLRGSWGSARLRVRQISDIVNGCVSPIASGAPHESQFDKLAGRFVRSNPPTYGVEVVFEVEFVSNSFDRESVLLNQGRKVANLSDRGYELCSNASSVCDMVASQYKTDGI